MRGRVGTAAALGAGIVVMLTSAAPGALAGPVAGLHVSLSPERLGASAAVTVAVSIADAEAKGGVAPPLRTLAVRLPPGLSVHLPASGPVCKPAALARHGADGCPVSTRVGAGRATLVVHAGSQTIHEAATLTAFRGPSADGRLTLTILGEGRTPLAQRSISRGVLGADSPPYGSRLTITVPPIPTLALEPDASFASMTLTVGSHDGLDGSVLVPSHCAAGGFRFAANLAFVGGGAAGAETSLPCP
jgi:hypothetical protein